MFKWLSHAKWILQVYSELELAKVMQGSKFLKEFLNDASNENQVIQMKKWKKY